MDREQIIRFLRTKGPSVPNDIKKALGGDTLIFGAILSELVSRNQVKLTKVKKGASPFYFLPGQEPLIEKLIPFLNPKDQQTIQLIKQQKVIKEAEHSLFVRVSLRNIPDFAKEFMMQTKEGQYRFWRYYLVSEQEAVEILKEKYNPKPKLEEQKEEQKQKDEIIETHKENKTIKTEIKPQHTKNTITGRRLQIADSQPLTADRRSLKTEQQSLTINPSLEKTPFYEEIINYFNKTNIEMLSEEQISKDREYSFTINIPSPIGKLKMYCRARNKKKLNEGDVAPALLKSKSQDLQCLFLTNGEFTKKSLQKMNKEYKGLIIKQLN